MRQWRTGWAGCFRSKERPDNTAPQDRFQDPGRPRPIRRFGQASDRHPRSLLRQPAGRGTFWLPGRNRGPICHGGTVIWRAVIRSWSSRMLQWQRAAQRRAFGRVTRGRRGGEFSGPTSDEVLCRTRSSTRPTWWGRRGGSESDGAGLNRTLRLTVFCQVVGRTCWSVECALLTPVRKLL